MWRRLRTVTLVLVLFLLGSILFVPLAVVLAVVDVLRRDRWILLRLLAFGWVYLLGEMAGTVGAGWLWLWHVRNRRRFIDLNYRLQFWWAQLLFVAARRALALTFDVAGDDQVEPGPILLFMRHASIVDNLLPLVLVARPHGMRLRYVLKRELLSDPALDIVGNRLPNHFVDRAGDTEAEREALRRLSTDLGRREGVIIFPEGTRFTRAKRERILATLTDSPYYPRIRELDRVLPPRFGGPLALLEGAPDADVIVCAHAGLEGFATIGDILSGKLVGSRVRVVMWRAPRSQIPVSSRDRIDWLLDQWDRVNSLAGAPNG